MREDCLTVQKNLKIADMHADIARLIRASQLEEVLLQIKDRQKDELSSFFEDYFKTGPLCTDMLRLCLKFCEKAPEEYDPLPARATVSTLKNPLALTATRELSRGISTVMIAEEADFRACCESVSSGDSDLCVIPACSSTDGYYPTFSKLIKAYELKICGYARISKPDSDEELEFALLSKTLKKQRNAKRLSFTFAEKEKNDLSRLIIAFSENGIETLSVISTPLEFNMDRFEHRVTVSLENVSLTPILLFLDASLPGHNVLGIY